MANLGDLINGANTQYGLPPGYLNTVANIESSGNPNAGNGSAKGLFQFIPSTAAHYGLANPYDPAAASDAAGRLSRDNYAALSKALGRAPSAEELYLGHQQGASGAAKLLLNPNAPAANAVGASAVLNNGGTADMTGGQFAALWARKYDGRSGAKLPFFAAASGMPDGGTPRPAAPPSAGSAPEGVYANAPAAAPQQDDTTALAAALSAPARPAASPLAALYAQQSAQQQAAAQAQRAALLGSARIAPTQQIT